MPQIATHPISQRSGDQQRTTLLRDKSPEPSCDCPMVSVDPTPRNVCNETQRLTLHGTGVASPWDRLKTHGEGCRYLPLTELDPSTSDRSRGSEAASSPSSC